MEVKIARQGIVSLLTLKKILVVTSLLGLVTHHVKATEFRAPPVLERGPVCIMMGDNEEKHSFQWWSSVYHRRADKAFTNDHGINTEPLASLLFNKSDFRLTEIFPAALVSLKAERYNPLLRTTNMHMRANYTEDGLMLGGRWDYPIQGTGRLGVRVRMPIKRLKMEKVDMEGVRSGGQLQDVLSIQPVTDDTDNQSKSTAQSILMRLDFAESLIQANDRKSVIDYRDNRTVVAIGTDKTSAADWTTLARRFAKTRDADPDAKNHVVMVHSPEGYIPRAPDTKIVVRVDDSRNVPATTPSEFPIDGKISGSTVYFFKNGLNYTLLSDQSDSIDLTKRLENQAAKSQVWMIPLQKNDDTVSGGFLGSNPKDHNLIPAIKDGGVLRTLQVLSEQVTENAFEWLHDRGVDFETFTAEGLGDLDIDLFYEDMLMDGLLAEVFVGLRAPIGKKQDYIVDEDRGISNLYRTPLGNNGHWEVRCGGNLAWQPLRCFGLRGDASYTFVLEATEERGAAFQDSLIKNFGPKVDAAVDWGYFIARGDLCISHPESEDVTGVIGYEFMYKRKEHMRFMKGQMASWLGQEYDAASTTHFSEKTYKLDSELGAEHTEGIAHRVRWEFSYVHTDWLEAFGGGSWTFAGKNMPREFDIHLGFNVAF